MSYYENGVKCAHEQLGLTKHAYSVLRNIGGALREGAGYLTPQAKSTLLGTLAGSGVGAITGGLSDSIPGGTLGGALMGALGGGAAGRLAPTVAKRFGKSHTAARVFGSSTKAGRPATREDLLKLLEKQSSTKEALNPLARTLGGSLLGAGVGAGLGSMTDVGAGTGALAGAAGGGLLGHYGPKLMEKLKGLKLMEKLKGLKKSTNAAAENASTNVGAAAMPAAAAMPPAAPTLPSVQDFVMRGKKGLVTQHSPELMSQLMQFTESPELFHNWAQRKGIDLTQALL